MGAQGESLSGNVSANWSRRPGSKRRHSTWKVDALPPSYSRRDQGLSATLAIKESENRLLGLTNLRLSMTRKVEQTSAAD